MRRGGRRGGHEDGAPCPGPVGAGAARCYPVLLLPLLVELLQPLGGLDGLPFVLAAAAFGAVLSMSALRLRMSVLVVILMAGLLVSTSYLWEIQAAETPQLHVGGRQGAAATVDKAARPRPKRRGKDRPKQAEGEPREPAANVSSVKLETLSVVLPCAFEGQFAVKTVEALLQRTKLKRLLEILVVDDGSRPPLRREFPAKLLENKTGKPSVRIIRHERTLGLIGAKKTGGDAAVGDVIVFFDCHISPRPGWEEAFLRQMKRRGDHRTVVVPTITSLDPDTWKEIPNGSNGKACYVLWNADFTWLHNPGRDVPLMSGGLLAMSRQWWQETEGYDAHMVAWGGENIDQSLRIWLCGGRIEVAEGAFVAHMWRDNKNPKTRLRYPIPTKDVMRNKARAASAWFDDFREKVFTFPEYEAFTKQHESIGPMSNFDALKSKLQCSPFTSYLTRFRGVYFDTGLVPTEIFQIREASTGLCLERVPQENQPHNLVLAPCTGSDGDGNGPAAELQVWHAGNRDNTKQGKTCCSGLVNWNFLQCLDAQALGAAVRTFECTTTGESSNQQFALSDAGEGGVQLHWRPTPKAQDMAQGCVAPTEAKLSDAGFVSGESCVARVTARNFDSAHAGSDLPASFRLVSKIGRAEACGAAMGSSGTTHGFALQFVECNDHDPQQVFHAKRLLTGFQVTAGDTGYCLDSAGGGQILVYPCYAAAVKNWNQVWALQLGRLVWKTGGAKSCVSSLAPGSPAGGEGDPDDGPTKFMLQTCAPKRGQVWQKRDERSDGSFQLRDESTGRCLSVVASRQLALGSCDGHHFWREVKGREQIQHLATKQCLDAGREPVSLYACHQGQTQRPQRISFVAEPGWLRMAGTWGDNGRKRWFEKCLDWAPAKPVGVSIQKCKVAVSRGIRWERVDARTPLERRLWERSGATLPDAAQ